MVNKQIKEIFDTFELTIKCKELCEVTKYKIELLNVNSGSAPSLKIYKNGVKSTSIDILHLFTLLESRGIVLQGDSNSLTVKLYSKTSDGLVDYTGENGIYVALLDSGNTKALGVELVGDGSDITLTFSEELV